MFGDDGGQLRAFYEQLPLGVMVENYSSVKQRMDQLRADGITDVATFLADNPHELNDMVRTIQITSANARLLQLYGVNSFQEFLGLYDDFDSWSESGWMASYGEVFTSLVHGKPCSGEFSDQTATGASIHLGFVSWIMDGREGDWSVVITTHEDITARKQAEAEVIFNERRFRALYNQSPMGITVHDYSAVKRQIDQLRAQGIKGFQTYFDENPDAFLACMDSMRLVDANDTQLRMFGVETFDEYRGYEESASIMDHEEWAVAYLQELISFADGNVTYSVDISDQQDDGTPLDIRMISRISDNALEDWSEIIATHEDVTARNQAASAVKVNEQRFRALFHQSPLGITVQDYSGAKRKIDDLRARGIHDIQAYFRDNWEAFLACIDCITLIDANDTQIKMFGTGSYEEYVAFEEAPSVSDDGVWHESYLQELTAYAAGGVTHSVEVSDYRADGMPIDVRMMSRISDNALDDWSEVVSTHEDITVRTHTEANLLSSERRFRALYHQSPLGITVQDYSGAKRQIDQLRAQGIDDIETHLRNNPEVLRVCVEGVRLVDANDTQVRMFGIETLDEYREWETPSALMDDEEWLESYLQELITFANGEVTYSHEATDSLLDETPIDIRMISRISDNALDDWSEIISTHEDITDRKKLERMKSEFVSTVSHELRTPLTSIKGALGLVTDGALGDLPDVAGKMVDLAYKNTNRLIALVNDVLDMEKIASGIIEYEFAPVDLSVLVSDSIATNQGFLAEHGDRQIVPDLAPSIMVNGDAMRLNQVVANLLSNAIKFSPEGGEIRVAVSARGNLVKVSVTDQGHGIPVAFRGQIFQRFAQADGSDSRQAGGTGLGLSISKSIIETHGGEIGFDSEPGAGSTFFFTLPALAG